MKNKSFIDTTNMPRSIVDPTMAKQILRDYLRSNLPSNNIPKSKAKWATVEQLVAGSYGYFNPGWLGRTLNSTKGVTVKVHNGVRHYRTAH